MCLARTNLILFFIAKSLSYSALACFSSSSSYAFQPPPLGFLDFVSSVDPDAATYYCFYYLFLPIIYIFISLINILLFLYA